MREGRHGGPGSGKTRMSKDRWRQKNRWRERKRGREKNDKKRKKRAKQTAE